MRYRNFLLILFVFVISKNYGQSTSTTLDIVSWNIEFFGDINNGPADNDLQEANAKKVMRYLNADIYGLCEIVDTMRLRRLTDSLGANFGFKIADFCSNNTTGTGASWLNGQKLAFIYKKDHVSNVSFRGYLRSSSNAYFNFASGRFPYIMNADVTVNGFTRNINFIMLHGKAGSTVDDFNRRRGGALEMKDSMDLQYSNSINLIIGDYNDALHMTISSGAGPESSYEPIVKDSLDANHYRSVTIPLAWQGLSSMINFPNVIDNHIISDEAMTYYIPGSAKIRSDVVAVIPDYVSAHNTSDHWPVISQYNLAGVITGIPQVSATELGIITYPNPFHSELNIKATKSLFNLKAELIDVSGKIIYTYTFDHISPGTNKSLQVPVLPQGIYILHIRTNAYHSAVKIIRM
jgi:hypothetical protein